MINIKHNMNIQEDYVSLELAKLLKEKGFDGKCCLFGRTEDLEVPIQKENNKGIDYECVVIPTFQRAMKWLREVHKIHITISPISGKGYGAILCDVGDFDDFNYIGETDFFFHPEQAVEAGIKYALENLI